MIRHIPKTALISTALISLGLATAPIVTDIAQAQGAESNSSPPAAPLLAQIESCRQVSPTISGLNVRQAPSLGASVVGVVPGGGEVVLEDLGESGWAPVTAPYDGYVSTSYLTTCAPDVGGAIVDETPMVSYGDMCRQVVVRSGLNVRAEPTVYSDRVTALPTGTTVLITEPATETWVPITEPADGYVASRFLGNC